MRASGALFDGLLSPCFVGDRGFAFRLYAFRELTTRLGRARRGDSTARLRRVPAVRVRFPRNNRQLPGNSHDRHVQATPNRVVKKSGVHRFVYGVVAAKRKRNVADAAAHSRAGEVFFDPTRRFDEIDGVIAVLVEAGRTVRTFGSKTISFAGNSALCVSRL